MPPLVSIDRSVILRCTKELFDVLGAVPLADPPPKPDEVYWHANLL
jgi:hypothetical protein